MNSSKRTTIIETKQSVYMIDLNAVHQNVNMNLFVDLTLGEATFESGAGCKKKTKSLKPTKCMESDLAFPSHKGSFSELVLN